MSILKSAIEYGNLGFRSFPVFGVSSGRCSCGDPKCNNEGKHPMIRGWKHKASSNPEALAKLFKDEHSNLGIATGAGSNLLVIDVDPKNGGLESFAQLKRDYGPIDEFTLTADTGSGGFHVFYQYDRADVGNFHGNIFGAGIDIKCNGGYVVGCPSTHISGNQYTWRNGLALPAELGLDLEERILNAKGKCKHDEKKWDTRPIPQGVRNNRLFQIAAHYRAKGQDYGKVYDQLLAVNANRCTPPLSDSEIQQIAKSACRYEKGAKPKCWRDYWHDTLYTEQCKLKTTTKGILTALSKLMDESGGECTATGSLLALKANTRRETVSAHLKAAREAGWLHTTYLPKSDGSKGIYCRYVATIPNLDNTG